MHGASHVGRGVPAALVAAVVLSPVAACTRAESAETSPAADSGPQCRQTLAEECAQRPCIAQWPTDPNTFCSLPNSQEGVSGTCDPCGAYRAFVSWGVDTALVYYYDASTGELVAIFHVVNTTRMCFGGPPGFVEPTPPCDAPSVQLDCGDAG
jgi:hypothetical protein